MPAYLKQAPAGTIGDVTRVDESNIEPLKFAEAYVPGAFGFPYYFSGGAPRKWTTGLAATDFQGILVREVPSISGSVTSGFTDNIPNFDQVLGGLVRGYMLVHVAAGTPARNGVVYVQITANGGVNPGEFRADGTDSGNAVALTNAQASWASDGVDADGVAEIRVAR